MSVNWTIDDLRRHALMLAIEYYGRISKSGIVHSIRTHFKDVTDHDIEIALEGDE